MPDFSIIIVTWNALHHLKTFLPSVWEHSRDDAEIILADNASTDGTAQWVAEHYPEVRVVALDHNYGYCGGNNRAARQASGKYLLFLNNDVKVTGRWLRPLSGILDREPQTAALQPRIRSHEQPGMFEYAGAAGGFLDRHAFPFCRGRVFDTLEEDRGQYDDRCDIAWASGAALAIRADLFEELGGFDESFEFHMEEIDLCWRLRNRGYRVSYCPDSVVYHLGGGSLPTGSPRKVYYNFRNNLKMIFKNSAGGRLLPRLLMRLVLDEVALARLLPGLRFREAGAILRAHLHFFLALPAMMRQRKKLLAERTEPSDRTVLKPYSLIWHYFIRGRKTYDQLPETGH
ncbi:glycosyltransferase family 2 protein [Balneolales bacterium ANBcel1]|nr:glycosyltransferase family 2 protein [Balneolales bacterium ANBcel1]